METKDYVAMFAVVLLGIILVILGLWLKRREDSLDKVGVKTSGTIVTFNLERSHVSQSSDVGVGWVKGVEFITEKGEKINIKSRLSSLPNDGLIGSTIPVIYDPADPQSGLIDTFIERRALWMIVFYTGVLIVFSVWIGYLFFKN